MAVLVMTAGVLRGSGRETTPVTFRIGIVEPQAIDPAIVNSNAGAFITNLLFVSLTTLDTKTNELKPGVAERWDRNDDCTSWTFHLRPNRFANGEAVDAESFVRAYTRLAKKSANSEVAGFLESIVGFNAINSGTTNEFSGLEIIDANTLRIRTAEDCDFDRETSLSEFSPVPTVAGDARNASFNRRPIGNGPYRMAGPWEKGRPITLVRNPNYDLGPKPAIERIEITFETPEQSFDAFLRGERDYARVPLRYIADATKRYGDTDKLFAETKATLDYLYVSVNRPPYNSVAARQAISLAIDRDRLVAGSLGGIGRPADSVIPPSFGAFYRKGSCTYCRHDPIEAKRLAREGGLTEDTVIPLEYSAGDRNQAWVSAVADDIESTLGVRVELRPVAFEENSNKGKPGATGLFQHTWEADYPTPTDFLARIFGTGAFGNFFGYSNAAFDDEIASAIRQPDPASRITKFATAEDRVLADLPIIPIWNKTLLQVANTDRFVGVHTNFFDYPVLAEVSVAAK